MDDLFLFDTVMALITAGCERASHRTAGFECRIVGPGIKVFFSDPNEPNLVPIGLRTDPETGRLVIEHNRIGPFMIRYYLARIIHEGV
jgi:hypothetical protein